MESRIKNSYQKFLYDFFKSDILVICPNCSRQAVVKSNNFTFNKADDGDVKVICINCGYNKNLIDKPTSVLYSSNKNTIQGQHYIIGQPFDPFFHLPLWLMTSFKKYTLWAYNLEHLSFLRDHIEAKLRERNGQEMVNGSLGSRLPKWMTSKTNRDLVLKKLVELRDK